MLLIFMIQCFFTTQIYVQNWMPHEVSMRQEKTTPTGILMFFRVPRWLLLANRKNNVNCTIEKTTSIIIAKLKKWRSHVKYINSFRKFTKCFPKPQTIFSLRLAIFLATVGFLCKAIFVSKFGLWAKLRETELNYHMKLWNKIEDYGIRPKCSFYLCPILLFS